ncbi:DUF397 domain-containing protein [Dactylosporangium sp. CS-033363]|uniref:DUF397 domain-containing protein n=1 Tax=Dactylosporangium sp. CS-033363 TaxID=3239935 RepID=UPI003D8A0366
MTEADWTTATWRKSRRSGGDGECVEWARLAGLIGVRDSRDPAGPRLVFTAADWRAFVEQVRLRSDM